MHLREIADGLERLGHSVRRVWAPTSEASRLLRLVRFQTSQWRAVRAADVLYLRWHVLSPVHMLLARLLGVPYVLEVNGTSEDIVTAYPGLAKVRPALKWLTSLEFRGASHIIVVSPGLVTWARRMARDRTPVSYLPNGAPDALSERRRAPDSPPYAVFVGELAGWQGIDTLLRAAQSPQWPADLDLVVVGSGASAEAVAEASSSGRIRYKGRLGRNEAWDVLAGAVMSISPQTGRLARNRLGVTPLKVSESLMLGVPVVASDLPGQAELLNGAPSSVVVEPDLPEAFAEAVRQLAETSHDRAAISRYGVDNASWSRTARETGTILEGVVGRA
jgi:glycosyltransferase involved in cell wall biosynthesis